MMMSQSSPWSLLPLLLLLCRTLATLATSAEIERLVNEPGHLKHFGYSPPDSPVKKVAETDGFPTAREFLEKYVHESKPLVMKNAAKLSKAFSLWTDDYFLGVDEPADSVMVVESRKKENRSAPAAELSFKDFVRVYNETDQYMVNTVPLFIQQDVVLPGPLQCEPIMEEALVDTVMWFSSGGTKSVVHTDSVDNINCLFRGEKELYFVDPHKYGDKVDLDRPEGAYSDIDVDRADFTKYPGLADVEYEHVSMSPGDCLYIPYKWIHQVRSYGSNIAVNVWWDHHVTMDVQLDECADSVFDNDLTLNMVDFTGFDHDSKNIHAMRDHFLDFTRRGAVDFQGLVRIAVQLFRTLDKNQNDMVNHEEILNASDQDWEYIRDLMNEFDEIVRVVEERYFELEEQMAEEEEEEEAVYRNGREEL